MATRSRESKNVPLKELEAGIQQAEASGTVAPEIIQKLSSARDMFHRRDEFTAQACCDHSTTCEKIEEETYTRDWKADFDQGKAPVEFGARYLCGKEVGQFLKSMVSIQRAKRILEIGLFTGYSALCMAEALPDDGELVSLEICEHLKNLAEDLMKESHHTKKIKIILGPAIESVKKMVESKEKFDMIFLDGDKADYIPLVKMIFEMDLLSAGGTLLIDNAYHMGGAFDPSLNRPIPHQLRDCIKALPNVHAILLSMSDGIWMVRRMEDVERDTI
ncbi:caffeoyl-CoA o-methyltransferase [Plakobranchus ocellatus]|uniref:Caffeoyl-CoA o-methyltransferase n=1 Tax=Plakobranchus ocellatus TaxID=259542 RepID=A0AAV4BLL5_9GAST|nr:caffeoyl-CoA o-methyltransferase [Plakobranchus ocellatus]